jgi:hypothetical protein
LFVVGGGGGGDGCLFVTHPFSFLTSTTVQRPTTHNNSKRRRQQRQAHKPPGPPAQQNGAQGVPGRAAPPACWGDRRHAPGSTKCLRVPRVPGDPFLGLPQPCQTRAPGLTVAGDQGYRRLLQQRQMPRPRGRAPWGDHPPVPPRVPPAAAAGRAPPGGIPRWSPPARSPSVRWRDSRFPGTVGTSAALATPAEGPPL